MIAGAAAGPQDETTVSLTLNSIPTHEQKLTPSATYAADIGMLLKEVQGEDVTQLDYDSALDKVVSGGRPLVLSFFLPANIKVTTPLM